MRLVKAETPRKQLRFSEQFKQDSIRLESNDGYSFAAAAKAVGVGVGEHSQGKWQARLAPKPAPCGEDTSQDELREEIERLRRELRRAELKRQILKRSCAKQHLGEEGSCDLDVKPSAATQW